MKTLEQATYRIVMISNLPYLRLCEEALARIQVDPYGEPAFLNVKTAVDDEKKQARLIISKV